MLDGVSSIHNLRPLKSSFIKYYKLHPLKRIINRFYVRAALDPVLCLAPDVGRIGSKNGRFLSYQMSLVVK